MTFFPLQGTGELSQTLGEHAFRATPSGVEAMSSVIRTQGVAQGVLPTVHVTKKQPLPSFGEEIPSESIRSWKTNALRIGVIAICILSVVGIIPLVVYSIYEVRNTYRLKRALPNRTIDPEGVPQVGKYYRANIRVASTGDEGFEWKKKLIQSAMNSIEISANYAGGKGFREVLTLIEARLKDRPQLRAHLLLNPEMLEQADRDRLNNMQKLYGDRFVFLIYGPSWHIDASGPHTEENHVKLFVVDEKYFIMGGSAIHSEVYTEKPPQKKQSGLFDFLLSTGLHENDIVGESIEIAKVMRRQFFNLFQVCEMHILNKLVQDRFLPSVGEKGICGAFHESYFRNVKIKVIVGGPEHGTNNPITRQLVHRIGKARNSITLANMFFFPDSKIRKALLSQKGKPTITLISTGMKFIHSTLRLRNIAHYHIPDQVFEYKPKPLMHKKVYLFDETHTVIGSYNLGRKSALYDHEMVCVIKDPEVTHAFQQILDQDKENSQRVSESLRSSHFF